MKYFSKKTARKFKKKTLKRKRNKRNRNKKIQRGGATCLMCATRPDSGIQYFQCHHYFCEPCFATIARENRSGYAPGNMRCPKCGKEEDRDVYQIVQRVLANNPPPDRALVTTSHAAVLSFAAQGASVVGVAMIGIYLCFNPFSKVANDLPRLLAIGGALIGIIKLTIYFDEQILPQLQEAERAQEEEKRPSRYPYRGGDGNQNGKIDIELTIEELKKITDVNSAVSTLKSNIEKTNPNFQITDDMIKNCVILINTEKPYDKDLAISYQQIFDSAIRNHN